MLYPTNNESLLNCNITDITKSNTFITFIEEETHSPLQNIISKVKHRPIKKPSKKIHDEIPTTFIFDRQLGDILIYKRK